MGQSGQTSSQPRSLSVFLDCEQCPENYIRQNIHFVEFVRDLKVSEVHLLITIQNLAGGGRQYQLNFIPLVSDIALEGGIIRDQLFLPKGNSSLEEILLERKAIATDYAIDFRFGVAYTFGSVFNSIVNTRL